MSEKYDFKWVPHTECDDFRRRMIEKYDLKWVPLTVDATDDDLRCMMKDMSNHLGKTGFILTVNDYDDDPRGLYEIPECVKFFKKIVDLGFISLLELSTTVDGLAKFSGCPGLGALEVWLCATGHFSTGRMEISHDLMSEFLEVLENCNDKLRKLLEI